MVQSEKRGPPGARGQPGGSEGPFQAPGEAMEDPKGAGLWGGGEDLLAGPLRAGGLACSQGPQERSRGRPLPLRSHTALSAAADLSPQRSPRTLRTPPPQGEGCTRAPPPVLLLTQSRNHILVTKATSN